MDVAQSGPEGAKFGPNGENLDVVIGRFQSWAQTQRIKLGKGLPAGPIASPESREISYEQAMRASSYRRPMDPIHLTDPPDLAGFADIGSLEALPQRVISDQSPEESVPVAMTTAAMKVAENYLRQHAAGDAIPADEVTPLETQRAARQFADAVKAISPIAISTIPDADDLPGKAAQAAAPAPAALPGAASVERSGTTSKKRSSPQKSAKLSPEVAPIADITGTKPAKVRKITVGKRQPLQVAEAGTTLPTNSNEKLPHLECPVEAPKENFDQVLERTMASATPKQPPRVTYEQEVENSLTVRISEDERLRIESGAAKANLSVTSYLRECALQGEPARGETRSSQTDLAESIYLRQCALAVEELNDQVEVALARLYKQHSPGGQPVPRKLPSLGKILRHFTKYFSYRALPLPKIEPPFLTGDRESPHRPPQAPPELSAAPGRDIASAVP